MIFAGYSNIAIGAAEILGFKLTKNFDMPYFSVSISEFWKRWHITFSTWLRDYVYIPLGGNKCSKIRSYINLLLTFIVSGFWHGATINFAIWGIINGILIVIDKIIHERKIKFPKICGWLFTYLSINFTWIFFRSTTLSEIKLIFSKIISEFNILGISEIYFATDKLELAALIVAVIIIVLVGFINGKKDIIDWIFKRNIIIRWSMYYILIFSIIIFGVYGIDAANTEFIYSQF